MSTVIRNGFHVLPGLLTPDEIGNLRSAIEDSIDRVARVMLTPYELSWPASPLEERLERVARQDRAYASALLQVVMADAQRDARLTALAHHPSLAAAVEDILVPDVPTGHVIRTRAAIPSFRSRISPWHQDVPRPQDATGCATVRVACWIPCRTWTNTRVRSRSSQAPGKPRAPMKWTMTATLAFQKARFRPVNRMSSRCDAATYCFSTASSRIARDPLADFRGAGQWSCG